MKTKIRTEVRGSLARGKFISVGGSRRLKLVVVTKYSQKLDDIEKEMRLWRTASPVKLR